MVLTIDEIKNISVEQIVRQLLVQRNTLTILVSEEEEVSIQLKPRLKPLPSLDGYIPDGWKEAIYE